MELKPKFNHQEVEKGQYQKWIKEELFKANPLTDKKPFSIILPPPNVTGKLHLGHAWDGTLQDTLIRYKKCKVMKHYGYLEWITQELPHKQK